MGWLTHLAVLPVALNGWCQQFTNATQDLGIIDGIHSSSLYGAGVSVIDLDRDGWDDIVVPRYNQSLIWYRNTGAGFERLELVPYNGDTKAVLFGDLDNDGDYDIVITSRSGEVRVLRNTGNQTFQNYSSGVSMPSGPGAYGASLGDVNGDGWLDIYINSYGIVPNALFINNGEGYFSNLAAQAGVTNGAPVNNFAFQSSLIDLDFDGDLDIHVANDRGPIDALFLQVAPMVFENVAADHGLHQTMDSMCSSFCDFDNDGDYDLYVTNTAAGNRLYVDTGGVNMLNEAEERGVAVWNYCWGALWLDMDNDLWEDLYVANHWGIDGGVNPAFRNVQGYFQPMPDFADNHAPQASYSVAKGDFNRDGYYDIVINGFGMPLQVYLNQGGSNNWINVTLEGLVSNRDGVGAWFEYWIGGSRYIRRTAAGENYLSQNSAHYLLAMGEGAVMDSLRVHWPSGQVDAYRNIPGRNSLNLREGCPLNGSWQLIGNQVLCQGDSVLLSITEAQVVFWSDGDTSMVRTVNLPGQYDGWWMDSTGFIYFISPLIVIQPVEPEIALNVTHPACADMPFGSASLEPDSLFDSIIWSSGQTGTAADDLEEGNYQVSIMTTDGCMISQSFVIESPFVPELLWSAIPPACYGGFDGRAEVTGWADGGTSADWWVTDEFGTHEDPTALASGVYRLFCLSSAGCVIVEGFELIGPDKLIINLQPEELPSFWADVSGGVPPYSIFWSTGVEGTFSGLLDPGSYWVTAEDDAGCQVLNEFQVEEPLATVGLPGTMFNLTPCCMLWKGPVSLGISLCAFDAIGRMVVCEGGQSLNWEQLPPGVYRIVVREGNSPRASCSFVRR